MTTMNPIELSGKYYERLAELAGALNQKAADSKSASETGKANTKSVTQLLKDFAKQTKADGVPADQARTAMNFALTGLGVKEGTRKASGNHFAGFRAMLDSDAIDEKAFNEATVKTAQDFIASDEVKAKNAAKKEWAEHVKDWTADQWHTFLMERGIRTEAAADVSDDEESDIAKAAAATGTNG